MPLEHEIETYRRELRRLIAAGEAGRFVLIKGEQVVGIWDTQAQALEAGRQQFGLEAIAVKRIDPRDVDLFARMGQTRGSECPS